MSHEGADLGEARFDSSRIALLHQFHGLGFELIRESPSTSFLGHLKLPEEE
jgi:hypothetical protein